MMFFTLNIMENIRYFNTKISHFNYIFKIIQYILYYCRILCRWWASAGAGVIIIIIAVVISGHLQLPVLPSSSVGTCRGVVAIVIGGGGCGGCGGGCESRMLKFRTQNFNIVTSSIT